jgi:hypothetical protein
MFRKALLFSAMGCMLAVGVQAEEVYVRIAPPRAIVERPVRRPGPEYVYTPGYHRWDGHAHVWVPGVWVVPPRPHAHWVAHRWEHRRGGYVLVEGHWR